MTHTEVCQESKEALARFTQQSLAKSAYECLFASFQKDSEDLTQTVISFLKERNSEIGSPHYLEESTSGDKKDPIERLQSQLRNGWQTGGGFRLPLDQVPKWHEYSQHSRNVRYKIHSWVILDSLLLVDSITEDANSLNLAIDIADDWILNFVDNTISDDFAWYDMAVGQRATKLAYMLRRLIDINAPNEQILRFIRAAEIHFIELSQEDRIALHSNHGLFQMAGLLSLSKNLPWMKRATSSSDFAQNMLIRMLNEHFAEDGLHLEHSPDYHLYMVNHLQSLKDSGWISSETESLLSLVGSVEESAHWLTTPNQHVIPIGDTANNVSMYKRWSGFQGVIKSGLKLFQIGGLLIHNKKFESGTSQLVFSAQFHSRQHKHADTLNLLYFHKDQPILVDPGTFTYQYDIPERMYIESTRSHNTIEIDGLNHSRYRQDSFGSAIKLVAKSEDCVISIGEVHHSRLISPKIPNNKISRDDAVPVEISHKRIVIEFPNRFLAVIDQLSSNDSHDYNSWYHFHPDCHLREDSATRLGLYNSEEKKICQIQCYDKDANSIGYSRVRGQKKPQLQGWFSTNGRELIENDALGFEFSGDNRIIATVFDFEMEKSGKPYVRVGTGGRYLRFAFTQGSCKTDLRIRMDQEENYSFELEIDGEAQEISIIS